MSEAPLVLITGVSGFISSWVAYSALKVGYQVRGTVRSLKKEQKIRHLRDLCPGSRYKMELVEADLTTDAGWDEAVNGCTYILHVASPFVIDEPADKNVLIVPAVEGTLRVLRAASRLSIKPKRVIVTSSVAAVAYGSVKPQYTDNDWTVWDDPKHPIGAYVESKVKAERAAWDFLESLPANDRFELATINPTLVLGPMLSQSDCSSVSIIRKILMAELPGLPNLEFNIVSVFDVAKAHILAMTNPNAAGKRFIVTGCQMTMPEIAVALADEFKPKGYSPTTVTIPKFVIWLASFVDKQAKSTLPMIGKKKLVLPNNAKNILGINFHSDGPELLRRMAYGGISSGVIPDRSVGGEILKTYVRPEIDLSGITVEY